jgi:hypothetical protein
MRSIPAPSSHFAWRSFYSQPLHLRYLTKFPTKNDRPGLWRVAEDVDLVVVYPALMTLLLDAGRLRFPNEGRVRAEYRSGAPMPLSFRGKQASPKAYSAQSTKTR